MSANRLVFNKINCSGSFPELEMRTMQTIHAIYENGIFRPTEPVKLPDKCEVEISVYSQQTAGKQTTLAHLAEIGRQFPTNPELPTDLVAQHDHYLYGLPKQP